jgi:hypothetical protein
MRRWTLYFLSQIGKKDHLANFGKTTWISLITMEYKGVGGN